jgi:hypothetical protein
MADRSAHDKVHSEQCGAQALQSGGEAGHTLAEKVVT